MTQSDPASQNPASPDQAPTDRAPTDRDAPARRALLARIHLAKRALALEDDTYRDLLHRVTGHRSAADLSLDQLDQVLATFRRLGWSPRRRHGDQQPPGRQPPGRQPPGRQPSRRPLADTPPARKIRALWLALYQLGIVRDPAESALSAFARRQAGVDALQWLHPDRAPAVIEALKDMAVRDAGVDWSPHPGLDAGRSARLRVIEAQARRLAAAGADLRRVAPDVADWQARRPRWGHPDLDPARLDRIMVTLGAVVRRLRDRDTAG